ncbi:hypothetical protein KAR91_80465 [Candidatus Pacearchaeota archaeon]|nr:hypothetical protein [Candidatus Pacearchaeota archaeon]
MTGFSIPRNMNDVKRLAPYYARLLGMVLTAGGAVLIIEHNIKYDGLDLLDWCGHEYYGIGMIVFGFLISIKWEQWRTLDLKDPGKWIR